MTTVAWKLNRLRLMGVSEIWWRVQQMATKKVANLGWGLAITPPPPITKAFGNSYLQLPSALNDLLALQSAADTVLNGQWHVFALQQLDLGFPPQWNRDPKTGTVAPLTLGKAIDYRSERVVGDIKYLWEPSRHLELVTLALAWRATNEARYANGARTLLTSWFEQCPYPNGVHWTSSLELAVRLMNWSVAWHLLGGDKSPLFAGPEGEVFKRQWLNSVYQHCHFIGGYFSKHSSANNHLLGEYMGLFAGASTWPCWAESAQWAATATRGLEQEALLQNTADGVNKEQAIYYQHEVMDMMLLCQQIALANGSGLSAAFMQRLEKLAEFVAAIMDVNGNVPMIGDADDAQMVRLSYESNWSPYRSLLASCAVLFKRADFKTKAGVFDDKNRWLFGAPGLQQWNALPNVAATAPRQCFAEGGYWVMGDKFNTPDEVRLVVDAAPLGYLSIAAHGHADALALTLSVAGVEFLIDPGTFSYHTQQTWRNYFRGTSVHNTVRVDGQDQSVIGGNFMWLQKAESVCDVWQSSNAVDLFSGSHNGYQRLADPVTHKRRIELEKRLHRISVTDTLECRGAHQVELFWHFAERCAVSQLADVVVCQSGGQQIQMTFAGANCETGLYHGNDVLPLGWISRRFDEKQAIYAIRRLAKIVGTTVFTTVISY